MTNNPKIAINDTKQAELDQLKAAVTRAQYKVDQLQAIVTSLSKKQGQFQTDLTNAQTDRDTALDNLKKVEAVVAVIKEMVRKANTVADQTDKANNVIIDTANNVATLINQLIYSIEVIDKLTALINKKQASKVLISAELVTTVNTASSDANSAIALTLTALNNCYTSMASSTEAEDITVLEQTQALNLFGLVTGRMDKISATVDAANDLEQKEAAYQSASDEYSAAEKNLDSVIAQIESYATKNTDKVKALPFWSDVLETLHIANNKADQEKIKHALDQLSGSDAYKAADNLLKSQQSHAQNAKKAAETAFKAIQKSTGAMTPERVEKYTDAELVFNIIVELFKAIVRYIAAFIAFNQASNDLDKARKTNREAQAELDKMFTQFTSLEPGAGSLYALLIAANDEAKANYAKALQALNLVNRELTQAEANLVSANVDLNSLKSGLAAATAAALAA